jgi:hypoxanthine-DNA glycosylase
MKGLRKILFPDTRILIVGSFPGEVSLAKEQYYADGRNQFWKLLSAPLGENWNELEYHQKLTKLKKHRIGLWDMIEECDRVGSSDAAICNEKFNDFTSLRRECPSLKRVYLNGKKNATKYGHVLTVSRIEALILPNSSSANPRNSKWKEWAAILANP